MIDWLLPLLPWTVDRTGGYMVYAKQTFENVFDYRPGDVYWCTADCGWITGHTYITYGPLLSGATQARHAAARHSSYLPHSRF